MPKPTPNQANFGDSLKGAIRQAVPEKPATPSAPAMSKPVVSNRRHDVPDSVMVGSKPKPAYVQRAYWEDPRKVARYYNLIRSAPVDWKPPEWFDEKTQQRIVETYDYMRIRNNDKPWQEWKMLPENDPQIDFIRSIKQPDDQFLLPGEQQYRTIQSGGGADGEMFDWNKMPVWQQATLGFLAPQTPGIENRPGGSKALSIGTQMLLQGGMGAFIGRAFGAPGAAIGAGLGAINGLYTGLTGESLPGFNEAMYVLNLPSELFERFRGMENQFMYEVAKSGDPLQAFSEIINNLPEAWAASKYFYESLNIAVPGTQYRADLMNLLAWLGGDTPAKVDESWQFHKGIVEPVKTTGDVDTISRMRMMRQKLSEYMDQGMTLREANEMLYVEMVDKYGFNATIGDMVMQSILDPLNVAPYLGAEAGIDVGIKTKNPRLEKAMRAAQGNPVIDVLPAPIQWAAELVTGKHGSAGAVTGMETYKSWVKQGYWPGGTNAVPLKIKELMDQGIKPESIQVEGNTITFDGAPDMQAVSAKQAELTSQGIDPQTIKTEGGKLTWTDAEGKAQSWEAPATKQTVTVDAQSIAAKDLSAIDKKLGGLTADGRIKELEVKPKRGGIAGFKDYLTDLTPPAKAHVFLNMAHDNLNAILSIANGDPDTMLHLLNQAAGMEPVKAGDLGKALLDSPTTASIQLALRQAIEKGAAMDMLAAWTAGEGKRLILEKVSEALGEKPADVIQQMTDAPDVLAARLNRIAPELKTTPEFLTDTLKVFAGDDPMPFNANQFQAQLAVHLFDNMDDFIQNNFGLKPDHWVFRISQTLKGMQSLLLLGLNPAYFVNNQINNMVTRAAVGVFGYMTPKQIDGFIDRFGLKPSRLDVSLGAAETEALAGGLKAVKKATAADDVIGKVQRVVDATNKKLGIFSRMSGTMEQLEGKQAMTIGMRQFWERSWKEDAGFKRMSPAVEAMIDQAAPGTKDLIYSAVRAGLNMDEIEGALFGKFIQPQIDSVADMVDAQLFPDRPGMGKEILTKTGTLDVLKDKLKKAETPADVDRAFAEVEADLQAVLDEAHSREVVSRAASVRDMVKTERIPAVLQFYGDMAIESASRWLITRREWADLYANKQKGLYTPEQWHAEVRALDAKHEQDWRRLNETQLATYRGIAEELGIATENSRAFIAEFAKQNQAWREFYAKRRELMRTFFDQSRRQDGEKWEAYEKRSNALWEKLQDELESLYDKHTDQERDSQRVMDQLFGQMYADYTGWDQTRAAAWRQAIWDKRYEMIGLQRGHRAKTRRMTPEERDRAYVEFNQVYNSLIADMKQMEHDGAYSLMNKEAPKLSPAEAEAQARPTNQMQEALEKMGYTPEQIREMTPQQAWDAMREGGPKPEPEPLTAEEMPAFVMAKAKAAGIVDKKGQPVAKYALNVVNKYLRGQGKPEVADLGKADLADIQAAFDAHKIAHAHEKAQDLVRAKLSAEDIIRMSDNAEREAALKAAGMLSRRTVREKFINEFKITEEQADAAMLAMDLHADLAVKKAGFIPSEAARDSWYATHIADITQGNGEALFQRQAADKDWYYSQLIRTIANKMPNKASAEQVRGMLKGLVKEDELKWSGFDDFLDGKKTLTKQEALAFMLENRVSVSEVLLGDDLSVNKSSKYALPEVLKAAKRASGTYYSLVSTIENDGKAYRAVMERFPELEENQDWGVAVVNDVFGDGIKPLRFEDISLITAGGKKHRELLLKWDTDRSYFDSEHWPGVPNILAHIRFQEQIINGKRVLFIDEIQSDWHQAGRDYGYLPNGMIEPAPFSKNWAELAIKRMIRWAAENGYDSVALANAATQLTRYNLWDRKAGEGMIKFYDEILPSIVQKYIKKWGSSIADIKVNDSFFSSFDITPEMRASVMEQGQPLFQKYQVNNNSGMIQMGGGTRLYSTAWPANPEGYIKLAERGYQDMQQHYDLKGKTPDEVLQLAQAELEPYRKNRALKIPPNINAIQTFLEGLKYSQAERATWPKEWNDWKAANKKNPILGYVEKTDIPQTLYQADQGGKGSVQFLDDGRAIIRALNAPDLSTVMHEVGHIWRRELTIDQLDALALHFGMEGWEEIVRLQEDFQAQRLSPDSPEYKKFVDMEEGFARGLERYWAEGYAPTPALRSLFKKFTDWFLSIYKRLRTNLGRVAGFENEPDFTIAGKTVDIQQKINGVALRDLYDQLLVERVNRPPDYRALLEERIDQVRNSGRNHRLTSKAIELKAQRELIRDLLGEFKSLEEAEQYANGLNDYHKTGAGRLVDETAIIDAVQAAKKPELNPWQQREVPKITGTRTKGYGVDDPSKVYEMTYTVMDLDDVIASDVFDGDRIVLNPDYDQLKQPRDRSENISRDQIEDRAARLEPSQVLDEFKAIDRGAPIVDQSRMVLSGNGRMLFVRRAIDAYPERWKAYRAALDEYAPNYGIDPASYQSMQHPVLVRMLNDDLDPMQAKAFVADANSRANLEMTNAEIAANDVDSIQPSSIALLEIGEEDTIEGMFSRAANKEFVLSFIQGIPLNERGKLYANGALTGAGLTRIKNAIFAAVYTNDAAKVLLQKFANSQNDNIKTIESALMKTLPQVAELEAAIKLGRLDPDLTIANDLAVAADRIAWIRGQKDLTVDAFLAQPSITEPVTQVQAILMKVMSEARNEKHLREVIRQYAEVAIKEPDPRQSALFGMVESRNKKEILENVTGKVAEEISSVARVEEPSSARVEVGTEPGAEAGTVQPAEVDATAAADQALAGEPGRVEPAAPEQEPANLEAQQEASMTAQDAKAEQVQVDFDAGRAVPVENAPVIKASQARDLDAELSTRREQNINNYLYERVGGKEAADELEKTPEGRTRLVELVDRAAEYARDEEAKLLLETARPFIDQVPEPIKNVYQRAFELAENKADAYWDLHARTADRVWVWLRDNYGKDANIARVPDGYSYRSEAGNIVLRAPGKKGEGWKVNYTASTERVALNIKSEPPAITQIRQKAQGYQGEAGRIASDYIGWVIEGERGIRPDGGNKLLANKIAADLAGDLETLREYAASKSRGEPITLTLKLEGGTEMVKARPFQHGDYACIANVYKDGRLVAYLPENTETAKPFDANGSQARLLGLDPEDPNSWVYEVDGEIEKVSTVEPKAAPAFGKNKAGQYGMFSQGEDTPLFSGVAPRAQGEVYKPAEYNRQESLIDMRPQMKGAQEGGETPGSEGQLFQRDITDTPEFKRFFGQSKAVDKQGKPLVVYHGTPEAGFEVFDFSKLGANGYSEGVGFYFVNRKDIAIGYTRGKSDPYEVYLSIQKPMNLTQKKITKQQLRQIFSEIQEYGKNDPDNVIGLSNYGDVSYEGVQKVIDKAVDIEFSNETDVDMIASIINGGSIDPETMNKIVMKVTGYDGVIVNWEHTNPPAKVFVVFSPEQIKSVFNRGTFDPNNPNILMQRSQRNQGDLFAQSADDLPLFSGTPMRAQDEIFNPKPESPQMSMFPDLVPEAKPRMTAELAIRDEDGTAYVRIDLAKLTKIKQTLELYPDAKITYRILDAGGKVVRSGEDAREITAPQLRQSVDNMTPEELRHAIRHDELTGLKNRRAYDEAEKLPIQVVIDLEGLKYVNTVGGHAAGDAALQAMGRSMLAVSPESYRGSTRGDEFFMQFNTREEAEAGIKRVEELLMNELIEITPVREVDGEVITDGTPYKVRGMGFSAGIGESLAEADKQLTARKVFEQREGRRAQRGEKPVNMQPVEEDTAPVNIRPSDVPMGSVPLNGTPAPEPAAATLGEVTAEQVRPMLRRMRQEYKGQMGRESKFSDLDPASQKAVRDWLNRSVRSDMASTKHAAVKYGEQMRDSALLNYSRRYGADNFLNIIFPYSFWYTRSMVNWSRRMIDRPAWFAMYARLKQAQEKMERTGMPTRLRGKMRMPMAWLPDWAGGGMWFDPVSKIFPPAQFGQPLEQYGADVNMINRRTEQILDDLVSSQEISYADAQAAKQARSGKVWERAQTQAEIELDKSANPATLAGMMQTPALWWQIPLALASGKPALSNPLPITRTGQTIRTLGKDTFFEPVTNLAGTILAGPEEAIRKASKVSEFGEWGDYYIDRNLAAMAADGSITPEEARIAMIQRNGAAYEEAVRRVQYEMAMRTPGAAGIQAIKEGATPAQILTATLTSVFGGQLFTDGELKYRQLKAEYDKAWSELNAGDETALDRFFEKNPEYAARLALYDKPEERLHQFLVDEIWKRYMSLEKPNRQKANQALGQDFIDSFLNKETRSIDTLDDRVLATWAQQLGAMLPKVESLEGLPEGAQPDYYQPAEVQAIQKYQAERQARYPNYYAWQQAYYALPAGQQRRDFLKRYPQLAEYWSWKRQYSEQHPEIVPYLEDQKNNHADDLATSELTAPLVRQLVDYGLGGKLGTGAKSELERIRKKFAPEMSAEDFIDMMVATVLR